MFKIIDNIKIEYDYKKNGNKTIVFLHGFGGNLCSFNSLANTFYNFGYSTLNINLTDYGFKTLKSSFTIYNYAELVFKLIKKLKIKNTILIGHSFGGRISIILFSMFNNLWVNFNKVVLVSSAGIKPKFNLQNKIKILKYKHLKKQVLKGKKDSKILDKYGSTDYKTLPNNLKQVFNNVVNEDLTKLLKFINKKTLIVWGKLDKETPFYMAKILNKKIKNSQLAILNGDHFAYLQHTQKFISLIKNFIE